MIIITANNYYVLLELICALGIFLITLIVNDLIHNITVLEGSKTFQCREM